MGSAVFALVLLFSFLKGDPDFGDRTRLVRGVQALVGLSAVAAVCLQLYSAIFLHSICTFCFLVAVCLCGLAQAEYLYWKSAKRSDVSGARREQKLVAAIGAISVLAVIVLRPYSPKPTIYIDESAVSKLTPEQLIPRSASFMGDRDAPETLLVIGDLECPGCRKAYGLLSSTVERGKEIRVVYRQYPLEFHRYARKLAILSQFAAERNRFWPFVDECEKAHFTSEDDCWRAAAKVLGITPEQAMKVSQTDVGARSRTDADIDLAKRLQVTAIPCVIRVRVGLPAEVIPLEHLEGFLKSLA